MSKKVIAILSIVSVLAVATGCTNKTTSLNNTVVSENIENVDTKIILGDSISVEGEGVSVENDKVIINSVGTYEITGTLNDGQIVVNAGDEDNVKLVLNGANISCSNSAPIYVMNAKNAYVVLANGSENVVTDGENYVYEDTTSDEPNATIFSKSDLFISGTGKLTVNSNFNNAVTSKDDLEIGEATIEITSVADGFRGKDSITIVSGNININATGDGMKSNNTEDTEKGYIEIQSGNINITSGEDGIQAETNLNILDGTINITSGGGSENVVKTNSNNEKMNFGGEKPSQDAVSGASESMDNGANNTSANSNNIELINLATETSSDSESTSMKGIKAGQKIKIDSGNININSADDSIHSNNTIEINGGIFNISSGDDGIHADSVIDLNSGTIDISKSYEGIEAETININDGDIKVVASDDGINAAGGNDGSSINGRPGQNNFASSGKGNINLNGGKLVVDANGDGIDANGSIYMKDGIVIVNGPEDNGNGALDYDGTFEISGGTLIAAGSSGMAQSPSNSSTQNSVNVFTSVSASTLLHIEDESGNELITFAPSKNVQSVVISSPNIKTGTTYKVYTGGESTGTSDNGLYSGGSYSGGTEGDSFTVSSSVTTVGQSVGGMGVPGGGRGNQGGIPGQGAGIQQGQRPTR